MLRGLLVDYWGVLTDVDPDLTEPPLVTAVALARAHGLRTGLLSNADALDPDATGWADLFDVVLLSGEVGFGKPDLRFYLLAADLLRLTPEQCVFVDDLRANVRGAARAGLVGVHHTDPDVTLDELTALFGFPFR
ncbi:MAG TPA: HAD-IA family hydrolase [Pseudonocardiaceae bacterium]|jgi:HAD superfamily hydrolase (TIGR01509 family)|nr:HAD-IA family hydrolase [Pseudonocardiaceae bacterium]